MEIMPGEVTFKLKKERNGCRMLTSRRKNVPGWSWNVIWREIQLGRENSNGMLKKKKKKSFLENQYLQQYGQTYLCLTQASTLHICLVLSKLLNLSKAG